jgi:hypothetical protein
MIDWKPITEEALRARVAQGKARMNPAQLHLWETIRIDPAKWQLHPDGDPGEGFWVVAIVGRTVIWYNDIEEGFNRSRYAAFGTINDYWCNQDELEITVQYLRNALEQGADIVQLVKKPFVARR